MRIWRDLNLIGYSVCWLILLLLLLYDALTPTQVVLLPLPRILRHGPQAPTGECAMTAV